MGAGPVITLDGPAGAGKSTTAAEVARRLGFRHLDSGALYRALTYALLEAGVPEDSWPSLSEDDLRALGLEVSEADGELQVLLGGRPLVDELRSPEVTARVTRLARVPAARASLLELQRAAGRLGRLVADGRDMGSVVFPDAEVKVYLIADLAERARRRLLQEGGDPAAGASVEAEASALARRDEEDSLREISPLRRPEGAVEIDTTALGFDEQVEAIVELVNRLTP